MKMTSFQFCRKFKEKRKKKKEVKETCLKLRHYECIDIAAEIKFGQFLFRLIEGGNHFPHLILIYTLCKKLHLKGGKCATTSSKIVNIIRQKYCGA